MKISKKFATFATAILRNKKSEKVAYYSVYILVLSAVILKLKKSEKVKNFSVCIQRI